MGFLKDNLPLLLPMVLVQLALLIPALVHIFTHKKYRFGNRILWAFVVFINYIGPILYFTVGRGEE